MDKTYPTLTPTSSIVVVANVLPSGAAFAVRLDDGGNCYIPVSVATVAGITLGAELTAKLVPNRFPDKSDRTPWLVVHLSRVPVSAASKPMPVQYAMPFDQFDLELAGKPELTVADRVRTTLTGGGVWTMGTLFDGLFPGKTRGDSIAEYNAISGAVRAMYAKGECAKFQLWRSSDQSKPSREWFTCYPEKADVDDWEE
jgi:hypothetical protein